MRWKERDTRKNFSEHGIICFIFISGQVMVDALHTIFCSRLTDRFSRQLYESRQERLVRLQGVPDLDEQMRQIDIGIVNRLDEVGLT